MVGVIGYEFWNGIFPYDEEEAKLAEFRKERAEKRAKYYAEKEKESKVISNDLEKEFPSVISEYAVQDAIHKMSHQKIKAEDGKKWGSLQITDERIARLIEVVKHNQGRYEDPQLYLNILERWQAGDFSQADEDHNDIWNLQGGTVGKATGVLSEKEEAEYVKRNFEN